MRKPVTLQDAAMIGEPRLQRFYDYWNERRAGRSAPRQRDINPADIPELLGFINIFDLQDSPRDYKVRLNGSQVTETLGREITGEFCSTVFSGADAEQCMKAFDLCARECQPVIVETSLAFCGKPYKMQTVIALPISNRGERVDMIVTAHAFRYADTDGQHWSGSGI